MSRLLWGPDTFYVGTLKGVGRIYQQTFIDTYSKVGFTKLYDRKTPVTAADLLNDRVLPFFEQYAIPLNRVLTDRGTEYCGAPDRHAYELYVAVENMDHTRTKTRHPQTNGICERFHKTMLNEFYRVMFRKEDLSNAGGTANRSRRMARGLQRAAPPSRAVVLWQDPDADVRRQCTVGEGENLSGLNLVRTRCLSDEVLTYTAHGSSQAIRGPSFLIRPTPKLTCRYGASAE